MTDKQTFFLRNEQVRSNCQAFIQGLPTDDKNPLVVDIRPEKRTEAQNRKLHSMLRDISKQKRFNGKELTIEQWKMCFVCAYCQVEEGKDSELVEFEGVLVNLRESTTEFGIKRLANLIEYVTAWGVQNGVKFNDRWGFYGR